MSMYHEFWGIGDHTIPLTPRQVIQAQKIIPYERNDGFGMWPRMNPSYAQDAITTAKIIKESKLVPESDSVIFSPSAFSGLFEEALCMVFEHKIPVIASELARTQRAHALQNIRANSLFIPLPNESVNLVFDRAGALWYECDYATGNKKIPSYILPQFDEYRRILKPGGALLIESVAVLPIPTTASFLDTCLGKNYIPVGYKEIRQIGNKYNTYRAYIKS